MLSAKKMPRFGLLSLMACGLTVVEWTASTAPVREFELVGTMFFECQCAPRACHCISNGQPTYGSCFAVDFAYIERGHYGDVKLNGLKAALVGDLEDADPSKRYATIYFDQKSAPAQREAYRSFIKFVFGPAFPVDSWPVKVVPIAFSESADKTSYTLSIAGILEAKAVMKRDKAGRPSSTVPAMGEFGNTLHLADNLDYKYNDKEVGKSWDLPGHMAGVQYFHVTKKTYDDKELLFQHADMSGTWNTKQKEMIQKMGLKAE